ncbi:MAG: GldG family protein [Thermoanaerobaculia bacterium]
MTAARPQRVGTSAVAIALGVALLAGVNWLGYRHWARADWTKARIYSLSETTKKIVAGLRIPVRITAVMTSRARLSQPVGELLNRYRALSSKIEVEIVDPERNPARAETLVREFGIRQNTVIFRSGEKKKYVEEDKLAEFDFGGAGMGGAPEMKAFKGEQAFTSAILEVTEEKQARVYFTAGHGEPALDSFERGRGYSEAKQLLERDNVTVAAWSSLGKGEVPADASAVVVAGPRVAFLEPETAALPKYLAGGGRALFLVDPVVPGPGAPASDFGLGGLLDSYGIKLADDIVIDPANAVPLVGPETVIANRYGSHPIVRSLSDQGLPVLFPVARSVSKAEAKAGAATAATMLIETTSDGWGETGLSRLDTVQKDAQDLSGPVTIALAVGPADEKDRNAGKAEEKDKSAGKAEEKAARIVVIGNSRFLTNGSLSNAGNANLFLNVIHWLTGEEKLVGIAPKTPEQASLALTRSQVNRIGLFAVAGLPVLAVLLGIWVWYRRRD